MNVELTTKYKEMVSPVEAADRIGYTKDYVTKLAREGKITARRNGRKWLVSLDSLKTFELKTKAEKERRAQEIREERLRELAAHRAKHTTPDAEVLIKTSNTTALAHTALATLALFLVFNLTWFALESNLNLTTLTEGLKVVTHTLTEPLRQAASFAFVSTTPNSQTLRTRPVSYNDAASDHPDFPGIIILEEDTTPDTLDTIRNSFSDDVIITEDTEDSGLITPVFRERTGNTYRYLMVPVTTSPSSP